MVRTAATDFLRRLVVVAVALSIATALWLPCVHLLFKPRLEEHASPTGLPAKAGALAARHLALWNDPTLRAEEMRRIRASNAEWDFMARTFGHREATTDLWASCHGGRSDTVPM
jgi:hypothetical protein